MLSYSPHKKISDIIDKIDKCMSKQGYNQYQERFHRINKALMSIQLHSDCYVSDFSVEQTQEEEQDDELRQCAEKINREIDFCPPIKTIGEVRQQQSASPQKMSMEQLLHYLETQLDQTEQLLQDELAAQAQAQHPPKETQASLYQKQNANTPVSKSRKTIQCDINREKLIKKYLKIELRLRTCLEEHEWVKRSSNKKKANTAMTKQNAFLPYLMRNFFEEKENMQRLVTEMNKRKSVFNQQLLLKEIQRPSPMKVSRSEKAEFKPKLDGGKTVSCFNIDDSTTISNENENASSGANEEESAMKVGGFFNQLLRNSIFKDKKVMRRKEESFAEKSEEYEEEKNLI